MADFSRRRFLKSFAAGAALAGTSSILPRRRYDARAQSMGAVYPTIFLMMRGGFDSAMHFDAQTGFVNRNVQSADIRETPNGIRWYRNTLSAMGSFIAQGSVVNNIQCTSGHESGQVLAWYGDDREAQAKLAMPWTAYLADQLLKRSSLAASPNLVTYNEYNVNGTGTNYIRFNNMYPSPQAAAQRVTRISDFTKGLDVVSGLPDAAVQRRIYDSVSALDSNLYGPIVQPETLTSFSAASTQANELLAKPSPAVWPPDAATLELFNLSDADIERLQDGGPNQPDIVHLAFAYQAVKNQLAYSVYFQNGPGWDTHSNHHARQIERSAVKFDEVARLLNALQSTPSPIDPNLSMLDTTHVVITSELGRANRVDDADGQDGLGTPHLDLTQAFLIGGNFKRDFKFGGRDGDNGVPADFETGQLGSGRNASFPSLHATIMKANGVDPVGYTSAPPINAVIRNS